MQLSDIRTELRIRCGISTNDPKAVDADLTSLINGAIRRISSTQDWPWLIVEESPQPNLAASTNNYAVPSNWRKTLRVVMYDTFDVRAVTPREYGRNYAVEASAVQMYTVEGGVLKFAPSPKKAQDFDHLYLRTETALSANSDVPLMPDERIDMAIELAGAYAFSRLRDSEGWDMHMKEYNTLIARYRDDLRELTALWTPKGRSDTFV